MNTVTVLDLDFAAHSQQSLPGQGRFIRWCAVPNDDPHRYEADHGVRDQDTR